MSGPQPQFGNPSDSDDKDSPVSISLGDAKLIQAIQGGQVGSGRRCEYLNLH